MTLSEEIRGFAARVEELESANAQLKKRVEELETPAQPEPSPVTPEPVPTPPDAEITVTAEGAGNLSGATIPPSARLRAEIVGRSKWVLNGTYVGTFDQGWVSLRLPVGENKLRLRSEDGARTTTVSFTVRPESAPITPSPEESVEPAPVPAPEPVVDDNREFTVLRTVQVTNRAEFLRALDTHSPGDKIVLEPGSYGAASNTVIKTTGPVWICGPDDRTAVFDRGSTGSGYNLHLDKANGLILEGVTLRGGQKGLMADETNDALIYNCDIGNTGHEALHFRNNSSDNVVDSCVVHDTGLTNASYGEGIYLGQSVNNWNASTSRTNGMPDRSDRNSILRSTVYNTAAECIDVKEGTSGGVIKGNTLHGDRIAGSNSADSYIDVKGNDYLIESNTAKNPSAQVLHGFETHILLTGWGDRNVFVSNSVEAGGKDTSLGFSIQESGSRGKAPENKVFASNSATKAPAGLTNITVS